MAKFCNNCGKELNVGLAFCPECGTPVPATEAKAEPTPMQESTAPQEAATPQQPSNTPPPQEAARPQPAYVPPPQPVNRPQPLPLADTSGTVSTGYFFGMMLLYSLPVVGWLVCVITAFAGKNQTKKNFAKALLIWLIIGLVFSIVGFFIARSISGVITDYINNFFSGQFWEFS